MKKIILIASALLAVSAYGAEGDNVNTVNTQLTENIQVQNSISKGESFMLAFGMDTEARRIEAVETENAGGTTTGGAEGSAGAGTSAPTAPATPVGVVTAAVNTITAAANNSVTIVTPYGKY